MAKLDIQSLRDRVERINTLPTIPSVLKKLLGVIENPKISLNEMKKYQSAVSSTTSATLSLSSSFPKITKRQ